MTGIIARLTMDNLAENIKNWEEKFAENRIKYLDARQKTDKIREEFGEDSYFMLIRGLEKENEKIDMETFEKMRTSLLKILG